MILDRLAELEDGTTMSPFSATALSTNNFDVTPFVRDIAQGERLLLHVQVASVVTGSPGGTVEFQVLGMPVPTLAGLTSTITVAAADTITWTAHGLPAGTAVQFTTSGTLPTGLTPNQTYFISAASLGLNTFKVATTLDAALAGTPVVSITNGTGSGTHTGTASPIVLGSSSALQYELLTLGTSIKVPLAPSMLYGTAGGGRQIQRPSMRYLFARYVKGGTVTGGKFQVDVVLGHQDGRANYPSGFQVL